MVGFVSVGVLFFFFSLSFFLSFSFLGGRYGIITMPRMSTSSEIL